jgi:CheY-like chemotaxis protein
MTSILLVDDEAISLRIMRVSLENDGYQVTTAFDGQDALEKITANRPDILITDIDMPRMTGKELCLHLEEAMPDRSFPIFVSTSLTALEHRDWSGRISNLFLLEKPISLRRLRATIRELTAATESVADGSN